MKLKLSKDVPSDVISLLRQCDFTAIPMGERAAKLQTIKNLLAQNQNLVPPKPTLAGLEYVETEVGNCPPELANLINVVSWNQISKVKRMAVLPLVKQKLKSEGILK